MSADTPYDKLRHFVPETDDIGLDGYRILERIGEGGSGHVFRAKQPAFERDVAIKVLSASGFQEETAARFERECRAVGMLSGHPNIVTIHDSGINRWGRPYIVMEQMTGGSLARHVATAGALDVVVALETMVKIAGAVETAHRAGILHRDVKPENVLLSGYGEPKLADFGIATIPGGYRTHTGAISASLAHAAPEVLDGAEPTAAMDVYSLGSTLFTLISGRTPFGSSERGGLQALIARIVTEPVPDLRPHNVAGEICTVIETAMAKDPASRFASAQEMGAALNVAQQALGVPVTEIPLADASPAAAEMATASGVEEVTLLRRRRVPAPPEVPVPRRRPRWRSPVAVAAVAVLVAIGAGGAVTLKTRRPGGSAASNPTGIPSAPTSSPSTATPAGGAVAERTTRPGNAPTGRGSTKPTDAGTIAMRDLSGEGALVGPGGSGTAPSGRGSYTSDGGSQTSTGDGSGGSGGSGGSSGGSEPEPAPPAPANMLLYHLYSDDGSYYFTTSVSELNRKTFEYDDQHREAAVWDRGAKKMRRICYGDGRCGGWVFIQKPAGIQTRPLYSFTGPHGDYYTVDRSEIPPQHSDRQVYLYGWVQ